MRFFREGRSSAESRLEACRLVRLGAAVGKDADGALRYRGNECARQRVNAGGTAEGWPFVPSYGEERLFYSLFFMERCDLMIVSTTPALEGMSILCYLNLVFGEVIVGTDIGRDFAAGFTNLFGGRSGEYEEALTQARQEAIEEMKKRAEDIGANAIVGVDIDYESHGQMLMVIASGTAVVAETLEKE